MRLVHQLDDTHWSVDPPDFDYGHAPVRHWTVDIAHALAGTRIDVSTVHPNLPPQTITSTTVNKTGRLSIDVVTDPYTELRITHDHGGDLTDVHVGQQWLLPTTTTLATSAPVQLRLDGDQVVAIPAQAALSITTGAADSEENTPATPPPTLALPDGRVAAWHNDRLILAYLFGGIATPR